MRIVTVRKVIELLKTGKKVKINTPAGFQLLDNWVYKGNLETLEITTEDKNFINVTPEHKFFIVDNISELIDPSDITSVKGKWIKAGDLNISDEIAIKGYRNLKIVSIKNIGKKDIYDLSVNHPCHCYFGNDFINHNSAKSLITQHALVATVKKGGVPVLVDSEYSFNPHWYKSLGGDPAQLIYYQPAHILDAYHYMHNIVEAVRKKDKDIPITMVYDSIAASPSMYEVENGLEKHDMGKRAQEHGKGIRQMMGFVTKQKVTWIAVNQVRSTFNMYGLDKDTVGGLAWKYAASVRIWMRKGKKIEDTNNKDKILGIGGRLTVEKNRICPPFKSASFEIFFDHGINPVSGFFDVLLDQGVITSPSQGWYAYAGEKFRESEFPGILKAHKELLGTLEVDLDKAFPQGISSEIITDNETIVKDAEDD